MMIRVLVLLLFLATAGCREQGRLAPYVGAWYGGFDTAMTPDPSDDLNPSECPLGAASEACTGGHGNPLSHLLMKLDVNADKQLTLSLYRTREDYEANRPLLLSRGCKTSIGPAREYQLHNIDKQRDETQVLATASFPLVFGNPSLDCTNSARFSARSEPAIDLALQVNPVSGARAVALTMEKSRRSGNYLYVKQGGKKVPVKLDLQTVGRDADEARRLCAADDTTALENKDGFQSVCVLTGRKKWSVFLPISPFGPGVTALWGSTRSPKWYRTRDEPDVVTYHRAVFIPVRLDELPGDQPLQ